jgi:hypothetical protein
MKALSVRQPWAELILLGRKRYELRSWETKYRGRLLIHAAQTVERRHVVRAGLDAKQLTTGALVGSVEVVGCGAFAPPIAEELRSNGSYFGEWQPGLFAWELREPRRLRQPVPCRGALGLWSVPEVLLQDTEDEQEVRG